MINDVNESVSCGNVGLNNCCVDTSALDSYRFVVVVSVQDVKVEEFLIDICWDLNNLREKRKNKKGRVEYIE